MRLFLAIDLPPAVREHLLVVQDRARRLVEGRVSWSRPEQFHITLRFLGEQCDGTRRKIESNLPDAVRVPAFALRSTALGMLPARGPRRVVMVGYTSRSAYQHVQARIEEVCVAAGVERETRPPLFHSTLGRLRPARRLNVTDAELYQHYKDLFPGPEFVVDHVTLFESVLHPDGAEHRKLAEFVVGTS